MSWNQVLKVATLKQKIIHKIIPSIGIAGILFCGFSCSQRSDKSTLNIASIDLQLSESPPQISSHIDLLCLQGLKSSRIFLTIADELNFPYKQLALASEGKNHLAILSKKPLLNYSLHQPTFTIKGQKISVRRGFQEVQINTLSGPITILNTHLKSRVFHPAMQSEMRRNELRLLKNIIMKKPLETRLLICGNFYEKPSSKTFEKFLGETHLHDLRPRDKVNSAWTHHDAVSDSYDRISYNLVSSNLIEKISSTGIQNDSLYRIMTCRLNDT